MQKINLLYVITKLELGGAQKQLLSLIKNLDKEKFNPFLFTAKDGLLVSEALSINGLTLIKSRYLERVLSPLKDTLALFEIYRVIKKNKINIVHTHSSKAGMLGRWAARLAKVKVILHTVHGWSFNDSQRLWRTFFIWLERLSAYFTDKLIIVSCHDKQKGLDHHIGREDKYSLIRYGINYTEFCVNEQNSRKTLGLSPKDLVVGMVSCFKPQKSPQDFIKLANLIKQILPGIKFLLVGDGVLRRKMERLISEFNLQKEIILTGWRRDIPQILSTIDVFVLTSLWEGLPIVVLEAMAAFKPVVATHTGGISDVIIEGRTGFLVAPGDMQELSDKLIPLLKNENLRRQIGQNAKDCLGADFSLENMVKHTQDLYSGLCLKKLRYVN